MTKIAPSTLRKYVAEFSRHLSDSARKQRGRAFTDADINLLKQIKKLYAEGLTREQVDQQLGIVEIITVTPDSILSLVPSIAQEFESLRAQIASMDQTDRLDELQRRLADVEEQLREARRPLIQRLFGRKGKG